VPPSRSAPPADAAGGAAALVLDGQRSSERRAKRCPNVVWQDYACKRRTCEVCGPRRARELGRVLVLDAAERAPTHCMTLTTADPETGSQRFRVGVQQVMSKRDGLRRWWEVEYFAKVEFTTGQRARDGRRRMHAHLLLKGLEGADVLNVESIARERWRAVTGAFVVEVAELRVPTAALHYLGLHHAKASQLPPAEWRGMAERASRGYWSKSIGELRAEARAQLWAEHLAWSSELTVDDARFLVDQQIAAREEKRRRAAEDHAQLWEYLLTTMGRSEFEDGPDGPLQLALGDA
jgi:hypothetical protein